MLDVLRGVRKVLFSSVCRAQEETSAASEETLVMFPKIFKKINWVSPMAAERWKEDTREKSVCKSEADQFRGKVQLIK